VRGALHGSALTALFSQACHRAGALVWSLATLLTAFTRNFNELLIRHTLVGIGEASFVILSPLFVADMFPVEKRGRVMGVFYLAIPVGTALGYLIGGFMGPKYGWRAPFYVGAAPGVLLALLLLLIPEPPLGQFDPPESQASGARYAKKSSSQSRVSNRDARDGNDDICSWRPTGLGTYVPAKGPRVHRAGREPHIRLKHHRERSNRIAVGWLDL